VVNKSRSLSKNISSQDLVEKLIVSNQKSKNAISNYNFNEPDPEDLERKVFFG
jgi:hypothetical protein